MIAFPCGWDNLLCILRGIITSFLPARPAASSCPTSVLELDASSAYSLPAPAATGGRGPLPAQRTVSSSDNMSAPRSLPGESIAHRNPDLRLLQDGCDLLHRIAASVSRQIPLPSSFELPETHSPTGLEIPEPPDAGHSEERTDGEGRPSVDADPRRGVCRLAMTKRHAARWGGASLPLAPWQWPTSGLPVCRSD